MTAGCANLPSKLFFTASIISILFLEVGIVVAPYLVLYFHTITYLPLFVYRIVTYWQMKQQLFLLDHCYVVNIFTIIIFWAVPSNYNMIQVQFGLAMGPLFWAPAIFRNSLVLNDVDRMTSCYIHVLPPLSAFAVRWMPKRVSVGWYTPFANRIANETELKSSMQTLHYDNGIWIWVVLVPVLYFWLHMTIYVIVIHMLVRPSEEYMDSFTYMRRKDNSIGSFLRRFNGRNQVLTYWLCMCFLATIQFLITPLWYCFQIINIVGICIQFLLITWNGATYHVDVYKRVLVEANQQKIKDERRTNIDLVRVQHE